MDIDSIKENGDISLSKLTGLKICDVRGYVSGAFGFPVFKVTKVVLENGDYISLQGEHDIAFIPQDSDNNMPPNMDKETLTFIKENQ